MLAQNHRPGPTARVSTRLTAALLPALVVTVLTGCVGTNSTSGAEHLERALAHQQRGEVRAALIEARNALQQNPDDARIQLLLGRLHLQTGQMAAAEKALRQARLLDPASRDWRVPMARVYLAQGEFRRLLDELEPDLYDPTPTRVSLLALRGQAHLELGELEQARQSLGRVLALDPEHQETRLSLAALEFREGNLDTARRWVEEVLADRPDQPHALFMSGRIAQAAGDPAAAVAAYDQALALWPGNGRLELARAEALLAQGDYERALTSLQPLKADRNLQLSVRYLEAVVAVLREDNDTARDLLEQILAAAPEHTQSRFLVGVVHYRLGQTSRAVNELEAVIATNPDFLQARKLLAAAQLRLNGPAQAVQTLLPVVSKTYDDPQVMTLLGSAYLRLGQYERGVGHLERAAALVPGRGEIKTQLALSYLGSGRAEQAEAILAQAVELGPDVIEVDVLRVMTHLQQGDVAAAGEVAQTLVENRPQVPQSWSLLALTRKAAGDSTGSRQALERVLELAPDDTTALINLARLDQQQGDNRSAEGRYRRILEIRPDHLEALLALADLKAGGSPRNWLEQAWQAHGGEARTGLALARHYFQWSEPDKAWEVLRVVEGAHGDDARVLTALGTLLLEQGQPREAAVRLLEATGRRTDLFDPWYWLARARQAAGDRAGAILAVEEALSIQRDHPPALALATSLYLAAGRGDEARRRAESWLAATPDDLAPRRMLAQIELSQGSPQAAVAVLTRETPLDRLDQWLEANPTDRAVRRQRAMLRHLRDDLAGAAADYRALLEATPNDPTLLNELAWLYNQLGDDRALDTARRAFEQAPQRPEVADTLGLILLEAGQVAQGLALLEQAAAQVPQVAVVHYHLAMGYERNGQPERARQVLERLLAEFPDFTQVNEARSLLEQLGGSGPG